MELRHIRYFITVAEELSFTSAAKKLLIAQPPLSRQIRDLEEELGAVLFERSSHGLRLTAEGISFLQYARQITDLVGRSRDDIQEMQNCLKGTIDIASVEGHAPGLLAHWIDGFSRKYPQVQYNIWDGSTDDVIYRISNGLSELGIITEPHNAEGLSSFSLCSEPWTAMIPENDPLALEEGDTVSVQSLIDKDLIIPSRESRLEEIRSWFPQHDTHLRIRCRVAHMLNAYELTRHGVGIAIFPSSGSQFSGYNSIKIKKIVDPEVRVSYVLVWNRGHALSRISELFIKYVQDVVPAAR